MSIPRTRQLVITIAAAVTLAAATQRALADDLLYLDLGEPSNMAIQDAQMDPADGERKKSELAHIDDVVVDDAMSDDVPNYIYATYIPDTWDHEDGFLQVRLRVWNPTGTPTWVRFATYGYDENAKTEAVLDEYDGVVSAGGTYSPLHGMTPFPSPPGGLVLIASDVPLLVFGDVYYYEGYGQLDPAYAAAWASKRTLDIQEMDCKTADRFCLKIREKTPWPVEFP